MSTIEADVADVEASGVGPGAADVGDTVVANLGLVRMWARKVAGPGGEVDDLVQDGAIGLIRAAQRYDPDKGFRFSTYANWWIRQAMQRQAVPASGRMVENPTVRSERRAVQAVIDTVGAASGQRPSPRALAEATGFSEAKVRALLHPATTVPLDAEPGGDRPAPADTLPHPAAEDALDRALQAADVRRAVDALPSPLDELVRRRFGLDGPPVSVREAARQLGISDRRSRAEFARAKSLLAESLR